MTHYVTGGVPAYQHTAEVIGGVEGRVIPIDPVLAIVGDKASPETYARVRAEIGLDLPLPVQYWRYLMKVVHGDFGNSVITSHPVLEDILAGRVRGRMLVRPGA